MKELNATAIADCALALLAVLLFALGLQAGAEINRGNRYEMDREVACGPHPDRDGDHLLVHCECLTEGGSDGKGLATD